jgi:hypothetical protein
MQIGVSDRKVFLVSEGSYSDYRIVYVCEDRAVAERLSEIGTGREKRQVEEYDVTVELPTIRHIYVRTGHLAAACKPGGETGARKLAWEVHWSEALQYCYPTSLQIESKQIDYETDDMDSPKRKSAIRFGWPPVWELYVVGDDQKWVDHRWGELTAELLDTVKDAIVGKS